jgi:hypothetical protein
MTSIEALVDSAIERAVADVVKERDAVEAAISELMSRRSPSKPVGFVGITVITFDGKTVAFETNNLPEEWHVSLHTCGAARVPDERVGVTREWLSVRPMF